MLQADDLPKTKLLIDEALAANVCLFLCQIMCTPCSPPPFRFHAEAVKQGNFICIAPCDTNVIKCALQKCKSFAAWSTYYISTNKIK